MLMEPKRASAAATAAGGAGRYRKYRLVRGISSGGSVARPPKATDASVRVTYVPVNLKLHAASVKDLCLPEWSAEEKSDKRRIIRIERRQEGGTINAAFSIVGSAQANPEQAAAPPGVDVVEVSCLECYSRPGEDSEDDDISGNESDTNTAMSTPNSTGGGTAAAQDGLVRSFYITSVEVIKIVELLISTDIKHPIERRRERGRIRSNLVPFWSKKPISTRKGTSSTPSSNSSSSMSANSPLADADFRVELAKRIMGYGTRKPRGFDKDVRILKWEKLVPALKRALQSYYVEIPN